MTPEQAIQTYQANTKAAIDLINALTPEAWRKRPHENAWSPMEVFQHILLSERGFGGLFKAPMQPANRPPFEKAGLIAGGMADRTKPRQAPERVHPPANQPIAQQEAAQAFADGRAKTLGKAQSTGYDQELLGYQSPYFGHMTVGELLVFLAAHCQRHLDQIKERKEM